MLQSMGAQRVGHNLVIEEQKYFRFSSVAYISFDRVVSNHQFYGHEFEQAPGVSAGRGSLACCSPWGRKELDTTEQLN